MKSKSHKLFVHFLKWSNIILMALPFALCWYLYYADHINRPFYNKGNWLVIILYAAVYFVFARVYDGLAVSYYRISEMAYSQTLSAILTNVFMYFVIVLIGGRTFPNAVPMLIVLAIQTVLAVVWSLGAHHLYYAVTPPKKTVIVYDMRTGMDNLIHSYGLGKKFKIEKTVNVHEFIANMSLYKKAEVVFISGVHSHDRNVILKFCVDNDIRVYVMPRVGDVLMNSAVRMHMFHLPMLRVERYNPHFEYTFFKRIFDILISGIALVVLSPIMIVTAIAIKAYDGGPVFYKQVRYTKDRKEFKILKFRSMKVNAEADGARLSSGDDDPRITPVGRIIRKLRIDEVPQLFNILGGSMSIVGPRPERPEICAVYEKKIPEFRLRLQAKAGLTGYAQVYGKYNTTPYDKLQMDLMYISSPSLLTDLMLCFATLKILFQPESTEGVKEGKTDALDESFDNITQMK